MSSPPLSADVRWPLKYNLKFHLYNMYITALTQNYVVAVDFSRE